MIAFTSTATIRCVGGLVPYPAVGQLNVRVVAISAIEQKDLLLEGVNSANARDARHRKVLEVATS